MWDDYIEWKAYIDFYGQILNLINDVRERDFKVA